MDLQAVTEKEQNKYRILRYICAISKKGTDEPIHNLKKGYRSRDTEAENRHADPEGKGRVAWTERLG